MRVGAIIVIAFLAGALSVAATRPVPPKSASATPATAKVTSLLQTALDEKFTPGRDVLVDLVEIPPGAAIEQHWHPGEEFQYCLEGEAQIEIEGQPTIVARPGGVAHIPFKKHHRGVAGPKGAKVLVFRVHTHGEPWRYVDKDS
jgi:quercetin dioxygenase-like cupin family protein